MLLDKTQTSLMKTARPIRSFSDKISIDFLASSEFSYTTKLFDISMLLNTFLRNSAQTQIPKQISDVSS